MTVGVHERWADQMPGIVTQGGILRATDRLGRPHRNHRPPLEKYRTWRMHHVGVRDDCSLNEVGLIQILAEPLWMKRL